jgi:GNAT superfamily N-acetyltransferase
MTVWVSAEQTSLEPHAPADIIPLPDGRDLTVRYVEAGDVEDLQAYLRSLSQQTRYNRFLGPRYRELGAAEIDRLTHPGRDNQYAVIATTEVDGAERIVGEARYAAEAGPDSYEFGLSVADAWQGHGIGSALLSNLECRVAALGATRLFGDTLRDNTRMQGLAHRHDFEFVHAPDDWRLVRMQKPVDASSQTLPCRPWQAAREVVGLNAA